MAKGCAHANHGDGGGICGRGKGKQKNGSVALPDDFKNRIVWFSLAPSAGAATDFTAGQRLFSALPQPQQPHKRGRSEEDDTEEEEAPEPAGSRRRSAHFAPLSEKPKAAPRKEEEEEEEEDDDDDDVGLGGECSNPTSPPPMPTPVDRLLYPHGGTATNGLCSCGAISFMDAGESW